MPNEREARQDLLVRGPLLVLDRDGGLLLIRSGVVTISPADEVGEAPLSARQTAPVQGHEGAPEATLVFHEEIGEGLRDLQPGSDVIVLTWLHQADRSVLSTRPRSDPRNPIQGVFSTRSPDRPNPI